MAPAPIALDGNRKDLLSSRILMAFERFNRFQTVWGLFVFSKFGTGHVN